MKKIIVITLVMAGLSFHVSATVNGGFNIRVPIKGMQQFQFDNNGIHVSTGTRYGPDGYDVKGYNSSGYDSDNYDIHGLSPKKCEVYKSGRYGSSFYRSSSRGNVYSQGSYSLTVFNGRSYTVGVNIEGKKYTHGASRGYTCGQMFASCKVDVCVQNYKPNL